MDIFTINNKKNIETLVKKQTSQDGIYFPLKADTKRYPLNNLPSYNDVSIQSNTTPVFNDGLYVENGTIVEINGNVLQQDFGLGFSVRLDHDWKLEESQLVFLTLYGPNGTRFTLRKMPSTDWADGRLELVRRYNNQTVDNPRIFNDLYIQGDTLKFYIKKINDEMKLYIGFDGYVNIDTNYKLPSVFPIDLEINKIVLGNDVTGSISARGWYYDLKIDFVPDEAKYFNKKTKSQPLICLTWDDAYLTDYTIVHPIIAKHRVKATSYVNGSRTGNANRASWLQLKEMYDSGFWDIQDHGWTHTARTELTEQQQLEEINLTSQAFETNGLPKPEHFTYPYGKKNQQVEDLHKQYYYTMRGTSRVIMTYATNKFNLRPQSWDKFATDNFDVAKQQIDLVFESGGILMTYMHEMDEERALFLEACIKYAKSLGIKFVTHSEMFPLIAYNG